MSLISDIYDSPIPSCAHIRLVTECDRCWERAFAVMRQQREAERNRERDAKRQLIESERFNFNPRGCPCCGYVIG